MKFDGRRQTRWVAKLASSWVRSTRNSGHTSNQRMTSFPFEGELSVSCAFGTQLLGSWVTRHLTSSNISPKFPGPAAPRLASSRTTLKNDTWWESGFPSGGVLPQCVVESSMNRVMHTFSRFRVRPGGSYSIRIGHTQRWGTHKGGRNEWHCRHPAGAQEVYWREQNFVKFPIRQSWY